MSRSIWEEMCRALESFKREHGHANVPAEWKPNPSLGRWAAAQRYRRRIGELTAKQVEELDRYGFVWDPKGATWNRMFDALVRFKNETGHCNVPHQWKSDQRLSDWVARQRHCRKNGSLSPEYVKRLDAIGFTWAIYGKDSASKPEPKPRDPEPERH